MRTPEDVPSHGDGVLWTGTSTARWPGLLSGGMVAGGVVLAALVPPAWPGAMSLLASTVLVLPLRRIEVLVVEAGVQVSYGRSGLVRQRFALSRLDSCLLYTSPSPRD